MQTKVTPWWMCPSRDIVGSLMWVANQTRPDIANAIRAVANVSHEPKLTHYKVAKKILTYSNPTSDLGLLFKKGSDWGCIQLDFDFDTYVDSDYARTAEGRLSVSDLAVCFGATPVSWLFKIQKYVTPSTSEAEYKEMADGNKEALYVRGFRSSLCSVWSRKPLAFLRTTRGR